MQIFNLLLIYCDECINKIFKISDGVFVSSPDSQSRGTRFDTWQTFYMLRAHQACYPFGVSELVPAWAGVDDSNSDSTLSWDANVFNNNGCD